MTLLGAVIGFDPREPNGNWRVANALFVVLVGYATACIAWRAC